MKCLQGLVVGLLVGAMFTTGIFLWNGPCPDCPDAPVDTVYVQDTVHHWEPALVVKNCHFLGMYSDTSQPHYQLYDTVMTHLSYLLHEYQKENDSLRRLWDSLKARGL